MSTSFDDFIQELEAEAHAEGPEAVAELEMFRLHFSLARQLAERRRWQNLTQKQLAQRSGIDQAEISRIERGQANPALRGMRIGRRCDPHVQGFGCDVSAVGPADRTKFFVQFDAREVAGVLQWLEDASPLPARGIDLAASTVFEDEMKPMVANDLDARDPAQMSCDIHARDSTEAGRCRPAERLPAREPSSAEVRRDAGRATRR